MLATHAHRGERSSLLPTRHEALEHSLLTHLGPVRSLETLGAASGTYLVRTATMVAVAKHMPADRPAPLVAAQLARVAAHGINAPALLEQITLDDDAGWYALFEYVEGATPVPSTVGWERAWSEAFATLTRLDAIRTDAPPWLSDARWVPPALDDDDPIVHALRDELLSAPQPDVWTFAHGDFAPQNFICGARGLVLVDWEELGYARRGYDAGWLLCLNRVGAGPRLDQRVLRTRLLAMGYDTAALRWSEGVGLLRMYRRATSWMAARGSAGVVLRDRVRQHIARFVLDGGDADARSRHLR